MEVKNKALVGKKGDVVGVCVLCKGPVSQGEIRRLHEGLFGRAKGMLPIAAPLIKTTQSETGDDTKVHIVGRLKNGCGFDPHQEKNRVGAFLVSLFRGLGGVPEDLKVVAKDYAPAYP